MSTQTSFSTTTLSAGTHTIYFRVQDNDGEWSNEVSQIVSVEIGVVNVPPIATIESITPNPAEVGQEVTVTGSGTDSDGTVTGYEWRSSIDGNLSTQTSFSTTTLSEGTHTIYFRVQDNDGEWSEEVSQPLLVYQVETGIIIDNGDAGTTSTGTWKTSGATNPYDTDSLWSRDGATYTWGADIAQGGMYEVYMWWTEYSSRSTSAPITITYFGGSEVLNVNQQQDGGQWNLLGSYAFDPAAGATVMITAENSSPTSYCADAVRFVYVPGTNVAPIANIGSINPNPADEGELVTFSGSGIDIDGTIIGYSWRSSIDEVLSTQASFSTDSLSEGTHIIYFRVQDNDNEWSPEVNSSLNVVIPGTNIPPVATIESINPNPVEVGDEVTLVGSGTDTDGTITGYNWRSSIDGNLSGAASFSTTELSEATHTIYFRVQDNDNEWSQEVSRSLEVTEQSADTEHIYVCFGYAPIYYQGDVTGMLQAELGASQTASKTWEYTRQGKTYLIHIVDDLNMEGMAQALKTEGAHVMYNGHSNYGLGALFADAQEMNEEIIDDLRYVDDDRILNISSDMVHIRLAGMRTGQAYPNWMWKYQDGTDALMPYDFGDPRGNPPYNYNQTYQVAGDPTYYKIETVRNGAMERFADSDVTPWYSPDGSEPDPANPDHLQYFITKPEAVGWVSPVEVIGNWQESYSTEGFYNENYHLSDAGSGSDQFKWKFTLPEAGNYRVSAWWPASNSRPTNAPYTIYHASGSTTVRVDQRVNGSQWNELGEFSFNAGETYVALSDDVSSGSVAADAIRIAHVDNPPEIIQSDFYARPLHGIAPLEVDFRNQGTGDTTYRVWDLGDGYTNDTRDRIDDHIYTSPGTYTVSLTVSGSSGSDTRTKVDYITVGSGPAPLRAEFSANSRSGTITLAVGFRDRSSGDVVSRLWDFGDGQTSTESRPTHEYQNAGYYTVSLTVTDSDGNSVTETKPNFVMAQIYGNNIDNVQYPPTHFGSKNVVRVREQDVSKDEMKYSRLFYIGCDSGHYFTDCYQRGVMFYTVGTSGGHGLRVYLKQYLLGRSNYQIWLELQDQDPIYDFFDFNKTPSDQ